MLLPTVSTSASREVKDVILYNTLPGSNILYGPSADCFILPVLGDFNVRVGSRIAEDSWWYERGPHGLGKLYEAGQELLSFLSTNDATIYNTWFKKKDPHLQTWQHPKSHQWHCIDYVIMRRDHRRKCLDVSVMLGANCAMQYRPPNVESKNF